MLTTFRLGLHRVCGLKRFRHATIFNCINPAHFAVSTTNSFQTNLLNLHSTKSSDEQHGNFSWKFMRKSLLLLSCGFGVYVMKNQLNVVNCHHEDEMDQSGKWKGVKITLYQYQTCPFCTKTRLFLRAHNIPFQIVEVHPIFKKEIKFSNSKKVPLVVMEKDGDKQILSDSSLIISVLSSYMINEDKSISEILKLYPCTKEVDLDGKEKDIILNRHWLIHEETDVTESTQNVDPRQEEAQWRRWADDYLVHLISPNVYRTWWEASQAFDHHVKQGRFSGTWEGTVAKYCGSLAMWIIAKKIKKKYNMSEDVRIDLYKACNTWIEAIGKGRKFMGGSKPNLADISVFGVLSVMEGLDSFEDLLLHSKIRGWYYRTKQAIDDHDAQNLLLASNV